jgi:hypothetical protein
MSWRRAVAAAVLSCAQLSIAEAPALAEVAALAVDLANHPWPARSGHRSTDGGVDARALVSESPAHRRSRYAGMEAK